MMVLERSFDSADLKRLLADSDMVVDRSLHTQHHRQPAAKITRPPLPKGSQVFEKVLHEFQSECLGPEVRVSDASSAQRPGNHHLHKQSQDQNRLTPHYGRSRANSRSDPPRSRPGSARGKPVTRPGSERSPPGVLTVEPTSVPITAAQIRPPSLIPSNIHHGNK